MRRPAPVRCFLFACHWLCIRNQQEISMRRILRGAICLVGAFGLSNQAQAQTWNAQQTEVWGFISSAWDRHADADTWHEVVDPVGFGWNTDYPVPTNHATMRRRAAVFGPEGSILFHRVDPLAITVSGDTAIAYYFANVVETDHAGKRKSSTERCADTLVRRSGQWRFLGWLCETKVAE
jgi:hypothetical protein